MLTNNDILKKLRVALQLRDEDIVRILKHASFEATKPEINALFRNEDHPNYKPCGDQLLRNFLNGLITDLRGPMPEKQVPKEQSQKPNNTNKVLKPNKNMRPKTNS
jgi:uncharacterized protein YehS (DUF1456 family)